jgi:pentatricopeptide repeat protein
VRGAAWPQIPEVFEMRKTMEERGVQADLVTYNQLIAACVPGQDGEFAFALMDELQQKGFTPDIYTYHNLLKVRPPHSCVCARSFHLCGEQWRQRCGLISG